MSQEQIKQSVIKFYEYDYEKTLFPMNTCRIINNAYEQLLQYINKINNPATSEYCFLPQQVVYASKAKQHLRRTKNLIL